MAEELANHLGKGVIEARSAGTHPTESVNPLVVEAMREIGYDVSGMRPKEITPDLEEWADRIITMGCGVVCPVFSNPVEDWALDDPYGQPIEKVREIRDEIERRVRQLVDETSEEE